MAIDSYSGLQSAVSDYVDGAQFDPPTMIALAEADFRRQIVATDQETVVALSDVPVMLPMDADSVRSISTDRGALTQISLEQFYNLPASTTGRPVSYATTGSQLLLWPTPSTTYAATIVYRAMIPALSDDNPSNWLLANHPDAYLFGSVLQAEFYGWNDARLPLLQAKLAAIIDDINMSASRKRYSGGQLVMRPTVTDFISRPINGSQGIVLPPVVSVPSVYYLTDTDGAYLTDSDGAYLIDA